MQVNAVIIDDEQHNIDNLVFLLQQYCQEISVVATAKNADDGKKIILAYNPSIVFLDIQMPGKNGFDLLKSLSAYAFEVIFVTAFDHYGIPAIKFAAIDYLLKPVNSGELKEAVQKAVQKAAQKQQNLQLENLIHLLKQQQHSEQHRIALTTLKETRFVTVSDIIRCESDNNYTTFFLPGMEKLMVSSPIYEYEEMLEGYGFIRCHQSHLVNKKYIKSWVKLHGGYLLLQDGSEVPVSRNKREMLKQKLSDLF